MTMSMISLNCHYELRRNARLKLCSEGSDHATKLMSIVVEQRFIVLPVKTHDDRCSDKTIVIQTVQLDSIIQSIKRMVR